MKQKPSKIISKITMATCGLLYSGMVMGANFDLSQPKVGSDGVLTIPSSAGSGIRLEDPAISIVKDADAENSSSLVFSGKQAKPAMLNIPEPSTSVSAKMKIKPSAESAGDAAILFHPGNFELRYSPGARTVTFFVYYKDKTPPLSVVTSALIPGKWSIVEIVVKGQDVKLVVDGAAVTGKLPEATTMAGVKSFFRIGMTGDGKRPFTGSLADISISEPAE